VEAQAAVTDRRLLPRTRGALQRQPATSRMSKAIKISAGSGCRKVLRRNTGEPPFPAEPDLLSAIVATTVSHQTERNGWRAGSGRSSAL